MAIPIPLKSNWSRSPQLREDWMNYSIMLQDFGKRKFFEKKKILERRKKVILLRFSWLLGCTSPTCLQVGSYSCVQISREWRTEAQVSLWSKLLQEPISICTPNVISKVTPMMKTVGNWPWPWSKVISQSSLPHLLCPPQWFPDIFHDILMISKITWPDILISLLGLCYIEVSCMERYSYFSVCPFCTVMLQLSLPIWWFRMLMAWSFTCTVSIKGNGIWVYLLTLNSPY